MCVLVASFDHCWLQYAAPVSTIAGRPSIGVRLQVGQMTPIRGDQKRLRCYSISNDPISLTRGTLAYLCVLYVGTVCVLYAVLLSNSSSTQQMECVFVEEELRSTLN